MCSKTERLSVGRLSSTFVNNVWCDRPQRWIWKRFRNDQLELILCWKCNTYRTSSSLPLRKRTTLNMACEGLCRLVDRVRAKMAIHLPDGYPRIVGLGF